MLLILAGVTIAALSGDNGILQNAARAKEESEKAEIIEQIRLDITDKQIENEGSINENEFYEILRKYGTISADETILTTTKGNYEILISDIYSGDLTYNSRKSNNLIDKTKLKFGIYVTYNQEVEVKDVISTDKIEIEANTNYISNRPIQTISFFDEDNSYISAENNVGNTLETGFNTPENAKYMIVAFKYAGYLDGSQEAYEAFATGIWLGKGNIENFIYEDFGTVNVRQEITDVIESDRIFYNTQFWDGKLLPPSEYNSQAVCLIQPKKDVSFNIDGNKDDSNKKYINDIYFLDKNLNIVYHEVYPSINYISLNTSVYPEAEYILFSFNTTIIDQITMKYNYNSEDTLKGKIIVGYGDSLTQGTSLTNRTWLGKVAIYFSAKQYNRGIGGTAVLPGSTTVKVDENGEYISDNTEEGITINSSMSHDERIATIPENADIVLFFGGTNGMDEESYRTTLDKIKTRAPNAKIICMNLTYRQTEDEDESIAEDYTNRRNIITNLATEYGYTVIQLKELMGVNKTNASQYMSDKVHFNDAGYTKIAIAVINQLKQSIQDGYIK